MTISTVSASDFYYGNDATTVFNTTFPAKEDSVLVYSTLLETMVETLLTDGVDYTITGDDGSTVPCVVTLTDPLATGYRLELRRVTVEIQPTELANQLTFSPQAVEGALDRLTMEIQDLNDVVGRSSAEPVLRIPVYNTEGDLPDAADRAPAMVFLASSGALLVSNGVEWVAFAQITEPVSYSTGTWTPVLASVAGTVPTYTATPLTGRYTKIGNRVFFEIYGQNSSGGVAGSGSNTMTVTLPIAASADALAHPGFTGGAVNSSTTFRLDGIISAGSSTMTIQKLVDSSGHLAVAEFSPNDQNSNPRVISLSGWYEVDP